VISTIPVSRVEVLSGLIAVSLYGQLAFKGAIILTSADNPARKMDWTCEPPSSESALDGPEVRVAGLGVGSLSAVHPIRIGAHRARN
jgi:hypothetical protein